MSQQLIIPISLQQEATFANFIVGDNQQVLNVLADQTEKFIFLWGGRGVGKSHLLQACCHQVQHQGQFASYLPMNQCIHPAMLEDLEQMPLVCIDDIDLKCGDRQWEEALMHLYNRVHQNHRRLIITAQQKPQDLPFVLADLKSRLTWGLTFQVHPLSDDNKLLALQQRAEYRGFSLTDEVGQFLMNRCARQLDELFVVLDKLDKASLMAHRKLTIPFIKSVLEI